MRATFCGHSKFYNEKEYERKIFDILEEKIGNNYAEIYLGEYGDFDSFAYDCCKKYKETHPNISLIFVTPYLATEYQKKHLTYRSKRFDSILYPEIEKVPLKFAILHRNRYMIDKSDFVIAYVNHKWGGAYQTYRYAKKKGKTIFNLADLE